MESQGTGREAGGANSSVVTGGIPPVAGTAISGQAIPIPPAPFFHGAGNQLPFLYSHSYMPPIPGFGFSAPAQGTPSATIDLTEGSPKGGPKETVIDLSKLAKKWRAPRKKPEIVELDDGKEDVELLRNAHHWRDHWVIQLISLRGEMQNTVNAPPKQGVDNWSRLHTKLVSLCSDFTKDSEACRKKWSSIYNEYKEDKAMNMRSGSDRSEKCRWYQLVDEFMSDRAHVVSHAHVCAMDPDGPKSANASFTNTTDHKSGKGISKSPEPKRKDDIFLERCLGRIEESSKSLMDSVNVIGNSTTLLTSTTILIPKYYAQ